VNNEVEVVTTHKGKFRTRVEAIEFMTRHLPADDTLEFSVSLSGNDPMMLMRASTSRMFQEENPRERERFRVSVTVTRMGLEENPE